MVFTPVWGEKFVSSFLNLSLPSMLSPENIPAVVKHHPMTWLLLTNETDWETIRKHPLMKLLPRSLNIEFVKFGSAKNKYSSLARAAYIATHLAHTECATLVSSMADQVWGEKSLSNLATISQDSRVVLSWCGVLGKTAIPRLESFRENHDALTIPHRELAKLLICCPHENQRRWQVEQTLIPQTPTSVIWRSQTLDDAVVRSHSLGAVAVNFSRIPARESERYQSALAKGFLPDEAAALRPLVESNLDVKVVDNSELFISASIDDESRRLNSPQRDVPPHLLDAELFITLAKHQRWESSTSRRNFEMPYLLVCAADQVWLERQTAESQVLVERLSQRRLSLNPMIVVWKSFSPSFKRKLLFVLQKLGVYKHLFRVATGYRPGA